MALSRAFILAYRAWRHLAKPIWNSRERKFDAPSYDIERAIDLLGDSTSFICSKIIGGSQASFLRVRYEDDILKIEKIKGLIEQSDLPADQLDDFRACLEVISELYSQIDSTISDSQRFG